MLDSIVLSFQGRSSPKDSSEGTINLAIISEYYRRVSSYPEHAKEILKILGLESAADPLFWQAQIGESDPNQIFSLKSSFRSAETFLPRVLEMLERDYGDVVDSNESMRSKIDGLEIQTVVLSDEGDSLSSPSRLIDLLTAVREIYAAVAEIEGLPTDGIAVVGLDSGSEKSFDFLGVARIISEVRLLLQFLYTAVSMHKQTVTLKNLAVVAETMPLIHRLDKLKHDNIVDEESASRIRHNLLANLEKFSSVGAYTPEMKKVLSTTPSLVMRPLPRLLTGPARALTTQVELEDLSSTTESTSDVGDTQTAVDETSEFSADELAAALKFLKAAKESTGNTSKPRRPARKRSNGPARVAKETNRDG